MGQGSLGGFFACLINGLVEFFESWMILFVASLIPLGLIFLRSRRLRGLAPVCILAGVWALPTLIGVISFMLGREDINPSFEYLSFDVVLTLVLLYFAVLAWRGKAPATNLWMITLILVVSTLTALAETLIPPAWADFSFALFLIVPILYQLFFDSVELNTEGPTRGQRILRTLGWQAGLMVVVAWAVTLGRLAPGVEGLEHVGAKIFLPVLLGLYLVNMNSERESSQLRMN
jgi:hypothetical protein